MILPRCSHRTALIGRIESQRPLPSQAVMLASNSPLLSAKNIRASLSTLLASRRATHWANWFQCPGGVTVPGPPSQYSAMVLWVSSSCLEYWSSCRSGRRTGRWAYRRPQVGVGAGGAELVRLGESAGYAGQGEAVEPADSGPNPFEEQNRRGRNDGLTGQA